MLPLVLAIFCVLGMTAQIARAQTYSVIHTFTGGDGASPTSTLVLDRAGNLYGTTQINEISGGFGGGLLFQLKRAGSSWTFNPLHDFGSPIGDGVEPLNYGGLTFGADGALYGSTAYGGVTCGEQGYCGVAFRARPAPTVCKTSLCPWDYTLLNQFTNVSQPAGKVAFDAAGNLYGTTLSGGVYELSPSGGAWNESVIYQFNDAAISAGMVMDNAGNLYGVWMQGTQGNTNGGVFELSPSPSGWTENALYSFTGGNDGATPIGGLVFDNAGNLYGTTSTGGSAGGGTVFELSPSGGGWTFNLVCSLRGAGHSGPQSALTLDSQGNLYGTTYLGGSHGGGSVFKASRNGNNWGCSDLHDFQVGSDGVSPIGGVALDSQGNLYGTTVSGGSQNDFCAGESGCGVVWEITPN
jgi:uncharacterized repeat protein (TIGR03803 family)